MVMPRLRRPIQAHARGMAVGPGVKEGNRAVGTRILLSEAWPKTARPWMAMQTKLLEKIEEEKVTRETVCTDQTGRVRRDGVDDGR